MLCSAMEVLRAGPAPLTLVSLDLNESLTATEAYEDIISTASDFDRYGRELPSGTSGAKSDE